MSRTDAWMPLWIGDYLKDTSRLSLAENGAYIKLLMDSWVNGPPSDDDGELCRILGCLPAEWRKIRPKMIRYFSVVDGAWTHKRLETERAGAEERSGKAATKARAAAEARWQKAKAEAIPGAVGGPLMLGALPEAQPDALPEAMHEQCPSPVTYSLPSEEPETLDGKAWREGVVLLIAAGRMKESAARTFFGKLLRDHQIQAFRLRPSILSASQNGTLDPKSYLVAAAKRLAAPTHTAERRPDVSTWTPEVWAVAIENFNRDGSWDAATMGPTPGETGCLALLVTANRKVAA